MRRAWFAPYHWSVCHRMLRHFMTTPAATADLPVIIIAAGGEGRRLGGAKPDRQLGGRSLLAHAIARAAPQSDCLAIAVRDPAQVATGGLPLLCDAAPGLGPISALASAFRFAAQQGRARALLIGCDQPFLPLDLAATLTAALAGAIGNQRVAMPVCEGKFQPLAALWQVDEAALADYIAGGGRSLWRFAAQRGVVHVAWPVDSDAPDPFANINDPATLAAAEQHFAA